MPRSGTQYLARLFALHPGCRVLDESPNEDWFLRDSELLIEYFDRLERRYREFGLMDVEKIRDHFDRLLANAGEALLSSLGTVGPETRISVSRTPSIDGIENLPRLFPRARAIVLVRDGRSVSESFHRTLGVARMDAARDWNEAVRRLRAMDTVTRSRVKVLRYEHLVRDLQGAMHDVLGFADLELAPYPFDRARDLPVFGSSQYIDGGGYATWRAVEKTPSFRPLARFEDWPESRHRDFNAVAGDAMKALGYPLRFDDDERG